MTDAAYHEPHGRHQTKKAAASGWIGSALEYYDFFIYATAATLVFPTHFFSRDLPPGLPEMPFLKAICLNLLLSW